jgi:hypothetical protein
VQVTGGFIEGGQTGIFIYLANLFGLATNAGFLKHPQRIPMDLIQKLSIR